MYGRAQIDKCYTLFEGELGGEYAVLLCGITMRCCYAVLLCSATMRCCYAVLAFITKSPSIHIKGLLLNRSALRYLIVTFAISICTFTIKIQTMMCKLNIVLLRNHVLALFDNIVFKLNYLATF